MTAAAPHFFKKDRRFMTVALSRRVLDDHRQNFTFV